MQLLREFKTTLEICHMQGTASGVIMNACINAPPISPVAVGRPHHNKWQQSLSIYH